MASGSYIVIEGKRDNNKFYIIREGLVNVLKSPETVKYSKDGILKAGDFFAVVSAMSGLSEIETTQARTDVTLMEVRREQFPGLVVNAESIALKILTQLSARVRYLMRSMPKNSRRKNDEYEENHEEELLQTIQFYETKGIHNFICYAAALYKKYYPEGHKIKEINEKIALYQKTAQAAIPEIDKDDWTRVYPKDSMIFAQGETGGEFCIINRGSVKLTRIHDGKEFFLSRLVQGDIFGEMSFLENKTHSSNAITLENTELMIVDRQNFSRINKRNPQIILKLAVLLSGHVWFWYKQLTNHKLEDPVARIYDMVSVLIERQKAAIEKKPFHLNITIEDLFDMVGISYEKRNEIWANIERDDFIKEYPDGRIVVRDIELLVRRSEQFWKMRRFSS